MGKFIVEHQGYKVSNNQRWARYLFLLLGIVTLFIWIVPLVSFWNTYHCLDLRHSGVGVAPDHASAWATGVVTVVWFMFSTWAIPQIRHWYWSYLFVVIGISHLALAMGIFLFIRLSEDAAKYFLVPMEIADEEEKGDDEGEDQESEESEESEPEPSPKKRAKRTAVKKAKIEPVQQENSSQRTTRSSSRRAKQD